MKKKTPIAPVTREVIETFHRPFGWGLENFTRAQQPSVWNGAVSVRKYRITAELIDEPGDVIVARIKKLWRECDNHHHYAPLKAAAKEYGLELSFDELGKDGKEGA